MEPAGEGGDVSEVFYILDSEHRPVPTTDWDEYARWMQEHKYGPRRANFKNHPDDMTRVGWTEIRCIEVSTVFLGMDHGWGDGPPILFETMVFGGPWDSDCERYCTWVEAEAGHAATVAKIRDAIATAEAAGYEWAALAAGSQTNGEDPTTRDG